MLAHPINTRSVKHRFVHTATLLDNQSSGEGPWFDILGVHPFTVQVNGLTGTGVVRIMASCATTPVEVQVGPDLTEDVSMVVKAPFQYVRAVISTPDTGPVNCWFFASQERN